MPLTDLAIRRAKPADRPQKLSDGGGLYLMVAVNGGRYWRWKYRFAGKEKLLAVGVYPEVPWVDGYRVKVVGWFTNDVFPYIGARPAAELDAPEFLAVARRIEKRGAFESAHRIMQNCGQVMRYAIATGRASRNPVADLRGALKPTPERHLPAVTDPDELGPLLRAMDGYKSSHVTRCALVLAPLLFVRPGELRQAEWSEFDIEAARWNIPAEKMKMRQPHVVPLSRQALTVLADLQRLTGAGRYLFPSTRTKLRPMSDNAVNAALRRMGYEVGTVTGHGFRATARTILDEILGFRPDIIEHQLAHSVKDPNGRAYNRTTHLTERVRMMQRWADYLNDLRAGAGRNSNVRVAEDLSR